MAKLRVTAKQVTDGDSVIDFILTTKNGKDRYVLTVCASGDTNTIGVFANGNAGVRFVTGVMSNEGVTASHDDCSACGECAEQMGLFPS